MRQNSERPPSPLCSDSDFSNSSDERPRKRRRTSGYPPTIQQIALEEIDLEISIRQRISAMIQSRMTWALLLQESVQGVVGQGYENFRAASLDALDAIEAPCDLIFNRDSPLVPISIPRPASNDPPPPPSTADPPQMLRVGSRSSRTRAFARAPLAPPKRLLFLRNTATTPPEIAKLACPRCSRFDFSNLQGLLNHCRIRHELEYGSHDECVQSCAVLVPEEEQELVVQNGVEVGGISLPSLRRLFEIAVGAGANGRLPPLPSQSATPAPTVPKTEIEDELNTPLPPVADMRTDSSESSTSQPTAHVTKTLGYHVDTPALAQFLGRIPKKRCINVPANEDDAVDIVNTSGGSGLQHRNMWRKPYTHRNVARKELDEVVPLSELSTNGIVKSIDEDKVQDSPTEEGSQRTRSLQMLAGTRFHISARVQVSDFSLYIPPDRRPPDHPDHTYRWRLAVTSPSYSLPISSVLSKLTVSSATDPSPSTLAQPITLTEPPFIITSTTNEAFLARLAFTWAGTMNAETEIEHWVELDPMQYTTAQLGEEQVFDVELDRHTELLPIRDDVRAVSWEDVQSTGHAPAKTDIKHEEEQEREQDPEWVGTLRSLLPQFPMTMRDTKGRIFSERDKVPYMLVASPAQFRSLNYGRRKAIEMARARTLRGAYARHVAQLSQDPAHQSFEAPAPTERDITAHADSAALIHLSTAEVFHWLEDEGLFPRSKAAISPVNAQRRSRGSRKQLSGPPAYCRACGLERAWHPTLLEEPSVAGNTPGTTTEPAPSTSAPGQHHKALNPSSLVCTTFQAQAARSPVVDVDMLFGRSDCIGLASSPGSGSAGSVAIPPRQHGIGRLVMREDWEGMPYSLHPAIFARGALHEEEEDEGEDLSASRPFTHLFPGSPSLSVRELNSTLVQMADPRLVTAIRHMTGLPSSRCIPFQAWIASDSPSSFHDDVAIVGGQDTSYADPHTTPDHAGPPSPSSSRRPPPLVSLPGRSSLAITSSVSSRRLGTTASRRTSNSIPPPLVPGIDDHPRDAVNALLAPSALLAIAMRSFVRRVVDRGVEALHHDESALRDARQKHLQPHGRGRRNMDATEDVRRVLTPTHVLGGLARHAGAGLADSAAFLVCATLGESSRRGGLTATATGSAGGIGEGNVDEDEDGSRRATGTVAR